MKTLILTEKPSVARDFAKALGVSGKKDGYITDHAYVITWAIGHLVELFEPRDYDEKWSKWQMDKLPILPEFFKYKPVAGTRKQLQILQRLVKDPSVEKIVIATDAGREGEVIARTILLTTGLAVDTLGDNARVFRFWSSQALTPSVVRDGMDKLQSAGDFDRLWRAGKARQIADWLVGMNGSRAATIRMDDLFSVGRVQTAVLSLLVDRRRQREEFTPEPYWLLRCLFNNDKGSWRGLWFKKEVSRFKDKDAAEKMLAKIEGRSGRVDSVKKQKKKQPPALLYALTDLQREANSRFRFSAKKTLDIAQTLYEEKKCLSYPRTEARVLGTKTVGLVKAVTTKLARVYPDLFDGMVPERISGDYKRVFNDARLTDHHAIIPLAPLPSNATDAQRKVYELVMKRFAAAFHPDCEFEQTEIITVVESETFKTRGKRILAPGWRAVYGMDEAGDGSEDDDTESEDLPDLIKGDPALVKKPALEEKETTAPPEYTEALLLKDMTHPGKYVAEDALKKIYRGDVGLGTQATRAQIIETLLSRKYVSRIKRYLKATDKGCRLIDTLRRFDVATILTSPEETARWEMQLQRIARGEDSEIDFLEGIHQFVVSMVEEFKKNTAIPFKSNLGEGTFGPCPNCGGGIIEGKKGFGCSHWRPEKGGCRFVIWKEIWGKKLSPLTIATLLKNKSAGPFDDFIGEDKKPLSARIRLAEQKNGWSVVLEPVKKELKKGDPEFGRCPICGGEIIEGTKGYGCANWRREDGGCRFVIWKTVAQKTLPKNAVKQLISRGISDEIEGFISKKGTTFSARLKLVPDQGKTPVRVVFEFSHP